MILQVTQSIDDSQPWFFLSHSNNLNISAQLGCIGLGMELFLLTEWNMLGIPWPILDTLQKNKRLKD